MRTVGPLAFVAALMIAATLQNAAHAQVPAQTPGVASLSPQEVTRALSSALHKFPRGGGGLVQAIEHLVTTTPGSKSAVVAAAGSANHEQRLAIEQGVVQALALLKTSDPTAAQDIQAYLAANQTDPVVAEIAAAENALGSANAGGGGAGGGSGGSGGGGGGGGGGFAGAGGSSASPS